NQKAKTAIKAPDSMRICLTTARARRYAARALAVVSCAAIALDSHGQQPSKELLRQLATPISARWSDTPARQAIQRMAKETDTPIWIDRRVDARKEAALVATSKPIAALIDDIALSLKMGAAAIDGVVYIGPTNSAAALPSLAAQWRR